MKNKMRFMIPMVALGAAVTFTGIQDADASRRASLSESRLIEDTNDVFTFPQLTVDYANLIKGDYGPAAGSGAGLFIFGTDAMAFGLGIHQGDIFNRNNFFLHDPSAFRLGGPSSPIPDFPGVHTIVDFYAGFDVGAGLAGVRLSLGTGGTTVDTGQDTGDAGRDAGDSSLTQTFVRLDGGYSLRGPLRLDTGLGITFSRANFAFEAIDQVTATLFELALTGRGYSAMGQGVELGFLGDFAFRNIGFTDHFDPDDDDDDDVFSSTSTLTLVGGAGPVYRIAENTTIAGYAVLGYQLNSADADHDEDGTSSSDSNFVIPGLHFAADIELTSWLYFRTGMQYRFFFDTTTQDQPDVEDPDFFVDHVTRNRDSEFAWNAGLGVVIGDFTLDGLFQHGFMTNGPNFIGGGSGLFSMVSASYRF